MANQQVKKQRHLRTKRETVEEEEERQAGLGPSSSSQAGGGKPSEIQRDRLEEIRLLQKLRKKAGGMGTETLAVSADAMASRRAAEGGGGGKGGAGDGPAHDPDEPESMAMLRDSYVRETLTKETDEDPFMQKFVEIELAKRLGKRTAGDEPDEGELRRRKIEEDLYSVPEGLRQVQEEVPIVGAMTGIAEVVLPLADRLKKIEETEAVKRSMLNAASRRAHIPTEDTQTKEGPVGKMKRNACPVVFGKPEVRRIDRDRDEIENLRRRVVSETRPLTKRK